jgi:hypothetical protein
MIRKLLIPLVLFACTFVNANAQSETVVAGGDASGSGGSVSYTVGLTNYESHSSSSGTVSEGLQHPIEILVLSTVEHPGIEVNASVYPNPTQDHLTITSNESDLTYSLSDSNGKLVREKKISGTETTFSTSVLAAGTYFLKITKDNSEIKSFKIIKK